MFTKLFSPLRAVTKRKRECQQTNSCQNRQQRLHKQEENMVTIHKETNMEPTKSPITMEIRKMGIRKMDKWKKKYNKWRKEKWKNGQNGKIVKCKLSDKIYLSFSLTFFNFT